MNHINSFLTKLLQSNQFPPSLTPGPVDLWQPSFLWVHLISNFLIGSAFLAMAVALNPIIRRRASPFSALATLLALMLVAGSAIPFMEIGNFWNSNFGTTGWIKALAALAAVLTAFFLYRLRPQILAATEASRLAEARAAELAKRNQALEKRVEESSLELQLVENKFKNTFENAAVGMAHVGLDGSWLIVNPRICEITGYSEQELLQKTFADITHPDDLDKDWEQAHALSRGEIHSYEMEKRYIRKDGSIVWIKLSTALSRNSAGEPQYFIACVTDVTTERMAREQAEVEKSKINSLFEKVPTPIALYEGPEHRIILANPEYRRQTGRKDLIGKTYAEVFPQTVEQGIPQLLTEIFKSGQTWNASEFHVRLEAPDGKQIDKYIDTTIQPYRDLNGNVEGLINLSYDVTEQVQARKRLEESEQRLQIAVRAANMGVWEWDVRSGRVQWDEHMVHLFGGPNSKFGGTVEEYTNRIHPEDREKVWSIVQKSLQSESEFEIEHRVIWDDGSIHWVIGRGGSLFNDQGEPEKILGVSLDVGPRKEALDAIKSSEERFRTLFEQSPLSIEIHAADGALLRVNQAWMKLWNFSEENIPEIIRTYNVLKDPQLEKKGIMPYIREGFQGRFTKTPPTCYDPGEVGLKGRIRWIETYISPVNNADGSLREVVIIHEDITERIGAEEALRSSKEAAESANLAKTQFLANMSHEIRTPLGAMLGFAELALDEGQTPEEQQRNLKTIVRNGKQLYKLIDELLDISKVEANKIEIEKTKFNLEEVIRDVTTLLSVKVEQKGIEFVVHSEGPLPKRVWTDPSRFKQILTNVIGNAIKFTEKGKVEVILKLRPPEFAGAPAILEMTVQDTGVGIPADKMAKLFQPFTQVDTANTRKFGGTGLGLYLSRKFAQALGGDVKLLRCEEHHGCTFQITIDIGPLEERPALTFSNTPQDIESIDTDKQDKAGELRHVKVLVVDDVQDNLVLTKMFLSVAGAQVQTALGAKEAFDLLKTNEFDIILMDIQMPHMDGYEAVKMLRGMNYRKPIVALTAHAMKGERERCLAAGFDGFLNKPINRATLMNEVKIQAGRASH